MCVFFKGGRPAPGTICLESFSAILKRFAAISCDFEAPRHVLSGSRQMDRTKVLEVLWNIIYMVSGRSASPLSIGIYWDCFGSVSIGRIYGIF